MTAAATGLADTQVAWLAVINMPLLIALGLAIPRLWRPALAAAPWAPLPALIFALLVPAGAGIEMDWLFMGAILDMSAVDRVFLLLTALVWLAAGASVRGHIGAGEHLRRFSGFYLLSMAGNIGLILAGDVASFYVLFALMSYAAYGLIVHEQGLRAERAARIYIGMTVMGEVLLLSGLILAAAEMDGLALADVPAAIAASEQSAVIVGLLLAGLGVKAGALPVHVWLPLAYAAAPTPASATLSGAMSAAGLLGWLVLLPIGELELAGWGAWGMTAGMITAYYGIVIGLLQRDPKIVLAYSSISQMGLMTIAVGIGLAAPEHAPAAVLAAAIFALHHGLCKSALFLGVGVMRHRPAMGARARALLIAGLMLPALAMAGLPLTSGGVAKTALKHAVHDAPGAWPELLGTLLSLSSTGTLLLLIHFVMVLLQHEGSEPEPPPARIWIPWALLTGSVAVLIWLLPWSDIPRTARESIAVDSLWSSLWPIVLGISIVWAAYRLGFRAGLSAPPLVPPGDLLAPLERACEWLRAAAVKVIAPVRAAAAGIADATAAGVAGALHSARGLLDLERAMLRWTTAILILILGITILVFIQVWQVWRI